MLNNEDFNKLKAISFKRRLKRRHIIEGIFSKLGLLGIIFAVLMLGALLLSIVEKGYTAFYQYHINLEINWDAKLIPINGNQIVFENVDYQDFVVKSLVKSLKSMGFKGNYDDIQDIISPSEFYNLESFLKEHGNKVIGKSTKHTMLLTSNIQMFLKGFVEDDDVSYAKEIIGLKNNNTIVSKFNLLFFINPDSRYAEIAGIKGAFWGSFYTVVLTIIFSVIIGIGTAIYLQEFAPRNKFITFLELNINNLASVPSIIFGLLGLIVFQEFFGIPRSTPLLASFVLTLMALPTIVITSRIALSSVPYSIREAAYGLGSSKMQVITKHLLPISLPGILTGIIISISRVIGETAPLLMIGMVAFVNSIPTGITDTAVVFPVQILLWANSPELGYIEKASAAIMLLLMFLISINGVSIYLRNKFEIKF
jgi:phosphate transport system permease protein